MLTRGACSGARLSLRLFARPVPRAALAAVHWHAVNAPISSNVAPSSPLALRFNAYFVGQPAPANFAGQPRPSRPASAPRAFAAAAAVGIPAMATESLPPPARGVLDFWLGPTWATDEWAVIPSMNKIWWGGGEALDKEIEGKFRADLGTPVSIVFIGVCSRA